MSLVKAAATAATLCLLVGGAGESATAFPARVGPVKAESGPAKAESAKAGPVKADSAPKPVTGKAAVSVFSATPGKPTGPIAPTLFGMHEAATPASALPVGSVRLWDTGTSWRDVEPANNQWNFTRLDAVVASAAQRKADVMLVLGSTPQWAAKSPDSEGPKWIGNGAASMVSNTADWTDYVTTVAKRYKGRISSYQVWNEGTLSTFWAGTPAELATLTTLATQAIRKADPKAKVVSTALLPRQATWLATGSAYLKALKARGWPVDVFSFHGYTEQYGSPDARVNVIQRVRTFLANAGSPAKPLWETEANFTTDRRATAPQPRVSGAKAADWMVRNYLDSARYGVDRSYWYEWGFVPVHLLIDLEKDAKAAQGFRTARNWLVGWTFAGCTSKTVSGAGVTTCRLNKGPAKRQILWASKPIRTGTPAGVGTLCVATGPCVKPGRQIALNTSPIMLG